MSDNKLSDRIERQLCMFFDEGYDGHLFDASQAIIDDLGLEWSCDGAWLVPNEYEQMVPRAIRVVGKWERI